MSLTPPFPYFGNKARAADLIWERLGPVDVYVEPFCGSAATLLANPHRPSAETLNDMDGHLCNFWRAARENAADLTHHANQMIHELDMEARHRELVARAGELHAKLSKSTRYYDVELAGWWVWGLSAWIGGEWCTEARSRQKHMPDLPQKGVHRRSLWADGNSHANTLAMLVELMERLRGVRVLCGDWKRALKPSVIFPSNHGSRNGATGIVLDPPYGDEASRDMNTYAHESGQVAAEVRAWCLEHGDDPRLRIALCGYDVEHAELEAAGWEVVAWKASGGYGRLGDRNVGMENRHRERIWFSPACLKGAKLTQVDLFAAIGAVEA